ncbi:uroporphyrinogen-III synthase [Coemansia aciculifera]|nr:uroporphyrinogen-III synthase [Coemansia aciculifera]
MHTAVILFRDSSRRKGGGDKDVYTDTLLEDHDAVESVPVLRHADLLTLQTIDDVLESHTSDVPFAAIIFTSQNAVEALNRVQAKRTTTASHDDNRRWSVFISLPVFVVGGATGSLCRTTLLSGLPNADVRGEELAGGARAMVPEIIEFCHQYRLQNHGVKPRLIFFCGDQRRDTLPDALQRHSDTVDLVQVISYTTIARDIDETRIELIEAISRIKAKCWRTSKDSRHDAAACTTTITGEKGRISPTVDCDILLIWMVVFSPSGARVVAPLLADLESEQHVSSAGNAAVRYRLAAIGKTTRDELVAQQQQGVSVVLANEPSVRGVRNALRK